MQTVSKMYGAADPEAQAPAGPETSPLGRAKVALICVAAALSGAAVASVARVRTRTYVADLYAGLGGTTYGPDQLNMKQCGGGKVCEGTERCYQKVKGNGETKYKCADAAEFQSLGSAWEIAAAASRGTSRVGTSKKKPQPCKMNVDPVCDTEGNWHSNACVAEHQKFKTISSEHVFVNGLSGPECVKR